MKQIIVTWPPQYTLLINYDATAKLGEKFLTQESSIIIIIYYYMIYIAQISRIESEALASLGGEQD